MADPLMIAAARIDKLEAENASLQSLLDEANLKWAQDMDRADAENDKLRERVSDKEGALRIASDEIAKLRKEIRMHADSLLCRIVLCRALLGEK